MKPLRLTRDESQMRRAVRREWRNCYGWLTLGPHDMHDRIGVIRLVELVYDTESAATLCNKRVHWERLFLWYMKDSPHA